MKSKTRKQLLRWILLPLASLVILVIIAIAVLYNQRQRLIGLAVQDLNKKIPGELVIGSTDISIFQNFPYISIGLNNIRFYGSKDSKESPIYQAERMFVGFGLFDILRQEYHVKVILVQHGHLALIQDREGILNIAEAARISPDTTAIANTKSSALDLDLKKIVLKNMDLSFLDQRNGQRVDAKIDKIHASLLDDLLRMDAGLEGDLLLDYARPGDSLLFRHKHLETHIVLSYDKQTKMLQLPVGKIRLDNEQFNISGSADLLHDNFVDFKFSGDKPDFRQLFSFAPETVTKELKHFRYDGDLSLSGKLKGNWKGGQMPLIELSFSCSNAWLNNTEAHKKLDSLAFNGYYTNGAEHNAKTSELRLLNMHARPGEGVFRGNFVLRDFSDPKVLMQVSSDLELGFIGAFLGIKDLQRITGHISLKMNFKELVDLSLPQKSMDELTEGVQSELTVRNLTFRIPHYPYTIEHLDLHAAMKNGLVQLDSMNFNLGNSDFHLDGSLSDLPALFHHRQKPVLITVNERSNRIVPRELLLLDTTVNRKAREEIYGFTVGLSLETSVNELLHPRPLPKGRFSLAHLNAAFKHYPHAFHDFGADLTINDTSLLLRNFAGHIDSSDIRFSGRVNNYALWFDKVMKGKTQVAFDLKSQRLAMNDLLGHHSRDFIPKDYQQETGSDIWLRSKIDLRYDSVFRFANIKIAHISGMLKQHAFQLDSISGNIKIGADNFIRLDTLRGKVGHSDFDISMRLYAGKDTIKRKKENFLQFSSRFLDLDELANYRLTEEEDSSPALSELPPVATTVAKTSAHAGAFNIFRIPFIDFRATVNVDKIKYRHLWMKHLSTDIRMLANQQLYLDTFGVELAEGRIRATAQFNGTDPQKIYLRSAIDVEDLNLEKMLLKLDYLGQDYVINKNIKGRLNGQIRSYLQVHPDLTPLMDNSEAELDIAIYHGELVDFAPMKAMASYFKDKNLNMVRFDTLQDKLTFRNGSLSIPAMNINSSLGYMEISGTQSLDMQMEYDLRIPLKMVTEAGFHMLFGKKKEEIDPDQVDAIEYRDKEKKTRFMNLKITGTPDAYKVRLGKAKKA